jgi:sulfur-oxidizing protein SoxX
VVWLLTATTVWSGVEVNPADASGPEALERGRQIVFEPSKGNCPACHQIAGAETPGDLGPPLVAIRARFPNRVALRRQLWDPLENNPRSRMPPFGRHRILTEDELDRVVDYIYSL